MYVVRGFDNLPRNFSGCVAAIGNFDSVHLGHQAIIAQLVAIAQQKKLPALLMIFEPQPEEYFGTERLPARLTRLREKLQALQKFAVDFVLIVPFNSSMANLSAQQFVEDYLVQRLHVAHLVVGDDFHFGKKREGNFAYLQKVAAKYKFTVAECKTININQRRVSSTAVRQALQNDDLKLVQQLLGRPYSMCGRVAHGDKRGRIIGFPTANIYLHRKKSPILGVYVVRVYGLGKEPISGVANVGTRPTVKGSIPLLEVHLFDFNKEIYGHYVRVEFLQKLREEQHFASFAALKAQILQDAAAAKRFLKGDI